jgi:eukaryotic-like serine/threonine-protein kinase
MTLASGTRFGRYEVRSKIGAGGMGEVYLTQDIELERTVALKLLPTTLASDQQRMSRFIQEAKAASALNHPNILTIYEIGRYDSTRFIVTEYIDGITLRQHLAAKPIKLVEALDLATQVASALSAAHDAGIIHRDVKPENVMLRRDGLVKVLDFGLAKLAEQSRSIDTEAPTRALVNTDPGVVMGTANYMSPEQARGKEVDARTDIWSLGVMLYEMTTGQLPFTGETQTDVIICIAEREPARLARYQPDVPNELERIVRKTLTKDREERYQTAKDLLIDLRKLRRDLDIETELERTVPPELRAGWAVARTGDGQTATGVSGMGTRTTRAEAAATTSSAEYLVREIKRHKWGAIAGATLVVGLALAAATYLYLKSTAPAAISSMVVLPFVNSSADPNAEWLSDGVTESLINNLSQLPKLRVMARSTAFTYKGKNVSPQQVGYDLKVDAVLMGRVTQRGDTLSIQVDLVNAKDGSQLWGEQYSRRLADVLAIQQEIAREVSNKLRLRLTGEQKQQQTERDTDNTEAYQLYLKGRYHWNKRTEEGTRKAIEYFQQAIEKDPTYALAYVGLAESYVIADLPAEERYPKAEVAALKALELDGTLGEAHATLAVTKDGYDWDRAGAEREYKRAIELSPNYGTAHHWYGESLGSWGRFDESFVEFKKALELDPLSLAIGTDFGIAQYYARQYDQSIDYLKKLIEMDPSYVRTHFYLSAVYIEKGMFEEALAEREKGALLEGENAEEMAKRKAELINALKTSGPKGFWRKVIELEEEDAKKKKRDVVPISMAVLNARLGDRDQAFAWLEKAYAQRDTDLQWLKVAPVWDNLRSDPRFQDLTRRLGFLPD